MDRIGATPEEHRQFSDDVIAKHPTYIEFPKHLVPKRWRHLRRLVCRLLKALYGHPEAGGHWERHLKSINIKMGGVKVPLHPSEP